MKCQALCSQKKNKNKKGGISCELKLNTYFHMVITYNGNNKKSKRHLLQLLLTLQGLNNGISIMIALII